MQPEKVQITNKDISYAEKILLKQGESFDRERKDFIRNLDTIDLQAVPGSGKTTALLAKLLILEKYLPFDDGSGILVISHTNAAIDEIKKKIGKKCSKIFSYPNFVGTIQSFVDQFLAIPYYVNCIKKAPYRINEEIYNEKIENYYKKAPENVRTWLDKQNDPIGFLRKIRFDDNKNLIPELNRKESEFKLKDKSKPIYKALKTMKNNLLKWGYLHYDDAYFLAKRYLQTFPRIKKLLQIRFRFVFVDEMQDMEKHQHDLLEELFYKKRVSRQVYQRVGDKNQAIFSGRDFQVDSIWINSGRKTLSLKGSHRISPNIANVVKYFGLEFLEIEGRNNKTNIKPHLIVFEEPEDVIKEFTKIIKKNNLDQIQTDDEYPFRAVGWIGKENDKGLTIKDYHLDFDKDKSYNGPLKLDNMLSLFLGQILRSLT